MSTILIYPIAATVFIWNIHITCRYSIWVFKTQVQSIIMLERGSHYCIWFFQIIVSKQHWLNVGFLANSVTTTCCSSKHTLMKSTKVKFFSQSLFIYSFEQMIVSHPCITVEHLSTVFSHYNVFDLLATNNRFCFCFPKVVFFIYRLVKSCTSE